MPVADRDVALTVRLLGTPALGTASGHLVLPPRKVIGLLAYLVVHASTRLPRDDVAYALNPDVPEAAARASLRRYLYLLQQHLPPCAEPWVRLSGKAMQWNGDIPQFIDVHEFERHAHEGRHTEAAALYAGHFLAKYDDEWIAPVRERLRSTALASYDTAIEDLKSTGDLRAAIALAQASLAVDPWREATVRELVALRHRTGDRAAALQAYRDFAERLGDELAVEPMPETTALYEAIARAEATAPSPQDAGEQRFEVPVPVSVFVGRDAELAELEAHMSQARLIALVGAGGVGKSRLALRLAQRAAPAFSAGAAFVELAAVAHEPYISEAVLATLGLVDDGTPVLDRIRGMLHGRSLLLVLDNVEHLGAAAAQLVDRLLRGLAKLTVVVTSREALGIDGEVLYRVQPLPQNDATALFAVRARALGFDRAARDDTLAHVAEICRRLDGIPLALELAAARLNVLDPAQIVARLDDRFSLLVNGNRTGLPHHQTLRKTIDWSFELLSEHEKILFRRLAIFAGTWTLESAERVCASVDAERPSVLDLLTRLVDKSLVVANPASAMRFSYLDTIRAYATEVLERAGELTSLRRAHLRYYASLAVEAARHFGARGEFESAVLLDKEAANVRAALQYALDNEPFGALALAADMAPYWFMRGSLAEAKHWLSRALAENDEADSISRAAALRWLAQLARSEGDLSHAREYDAQALRLREAIGAPVAVADSLSCMAANELEGGSYGEACTLYRRALELFEAAGDLPNVGRTLHNLAAVLIVLGENTTTDALLARSLDVLKEVGNTRGEAWVLTRMGFKAYSAGDYRTAQARYRESLILRRELGQALGIADVLCALAVISMRLDRLGEGVAYLIESLELSRRHGFMRRVIEALDRTAEVMVAGRAFEDAGRLLGAALALRERLQLPMEPLDRADQDAARAAVENAVGQAAFDVAAAAGMRAVLDDNVDFALRYLRAAATAATPR